MIEQTKGKKDGISNVSLKLDRVATAKVVRGGRRERGKRGYNLL